MITSRLSREDEEEALSDNEHLSAIGHYKKGISSHALFSKSTSIPFSKSTGIPSLTPLHLSSFAQRFHNT
jgi:hypothetical protein